MKSGSIPSPTTASPGDKGPTILKAAKYVGLGLGVLLVTLLTWGLLEPRFLDQKHVEADIPDLPAAWQGATVVQLSDWQVGMWLDNPGTVAQAIQAIDPERADMVVLTGDFVYGREEDPGDDYEFLARMGRRLEEAGIPTYAVLGNHDYRKIEREAPEDIGRARQVRRALTNGGVEMLHNEAVALEPPGDADSTGPSLHLVGIGSRSVDMAHPERALAQVPDDAPRLVIMHHPDTFARLPAQSAPLALAGHTHGGQIRLPGLPHWSWLTYGKPDTVHADGFIPDYGAAGNQLYVNRGIGMSLIPLRINCMPEMTLITLQPGASRSSEDRK